MSELWIQVLVGIGCGFGGAMLKAILMDRFFLTGGGLKSTAVFAGRIVIDVIVLFAMHQWTAALIAAAFTLTIDQVYFVLKSKKRKED